MKKFLFSIGLFLMSLSATAQRDCGLWLNEVPLVADTAAGKLYITLEQGISHDLSATLRWDTARYTGAQINGIVSIGKHRRKYKFRFEIVGAPRADQHAYSAFII